MNQLNKGLDLGIYVNTVLMLDEPATVLWAFIRLSLSWRERRFNPSKKKGLLRRGR